MIIIGAGPIGQSMGYILAQNDYQILGFISRSLASAKKGVKLIGEGVATTEYDDFISEADLIFITTPDQNIEQVAQDLFTKDLVSRASCLVHMSGACSSKILANDKKVGRLSLHPLQSIADVETGIEKLPKSFFTIEGNKLGLEVGQKILEFINADYQIISTKDKPVYHAAACVASNYLVAIINLAFDLNEEIGISKNSSRAGLLPLLEGTLHNIKELGPTQALTGPISRADKETIQNHLNSLEEMLTEDKLELYRKLGQYTTELAKKKGSITSDQVTELNNLLIGGESCE